MSHPIIPYAHAAFCTGFAATGGTVITERVKAGYRSAIEMAILNWNNPDVIEATIDLGRLEGIWAKIFARREGYLSSSQTDFSNAWAGTYSDQDMRMVVAAARHQAGVMEKKADPSTLVWTVSVILHLLQSMMTSAAWQRLRLQVADAIAAGQAYGAADAMELLAERIGASTFNFDKAFAATKAKFDNQPDALRQADMWLNTLVIDVANVIAKKLNKMATDGESEDDMTSWVNDQITQGNSPMFSVLWQTLVLASISYGIKWFYQGNGAAWVYFITIGDGDVCQDCEDAENSNPYPALSAPSPPLHPNCRCSLISYDDISGSSIADYLD